MVPYHKRLDYRYIPVWNLLDVFCLYCSWAHCTILYMVHRTNCGLFAWPRCYITRRIHYSVDFLIFSHYFCNNTQLVYLQRIPSRNLNTKSLSCLNLWQSGNIVNEEFGSNKFRKTCHIDLGWHLLGGTWSQMGFLRFLFTSCYYSWLDCHRCDVWLVVYAYYSRYLGSCFHSPDLHAKLINET